MSTSALIALIFVLTVLKTRITSDQNYGTIKQNVIDSDGKCGLFTCRTLTLKF